MVKHTLDKILSEAKILRLMQIIDLLGNSEKERNRLNKLLGEYKQKYGHVFPYRNRH